MFFPKLSHFFNDPTDVGNFISGSSAFYKTSLKIWKFMVHVLMKPGLENLCWQEYTEKLYKKDLHDPDNHCCVIIHLEPDSLECYIRWALGSITTDKASGDEMEFQWSYFKSQR